MAKVLITGGIKSGKSSVVLKETEKYSKKLFIATAEAFDSGMEKRILKHQKEREGMGFDLIEEPVDICKVIEEKYDNYEAIVIDCITLWLNNIIYYKKDFDSILKNFIKVLKQIDNIFIVTNEVGSGIMPIEKMSRDYIDKLGLLNAKIASVCEEVYMMCCGIKVRIK